MSITDKIILEPENLARDAALSKALHGNTAQARGGILAGIFKNRRARKDAYKAYFDHWDSVKGPEETPEQRAVRSAEYASRTRLYYDLVTDSYEHGWGQAFHSCRFAHGETISIAMRRHELYLAHTIGIHDGMKVLDVGCGVGGPARAIAAFTGAQITGININDYQVQRATHYAAKEGMEHALAFIKGDFLQMPFADNTFDAVYAIEATVHSPSLEAVYREVLRVLKPGGSFGLYEWLLTEEYNDQDENHRKVKLGLEKGASVPNMHSIPEAVASMRSAGFDLLRNENLADRADKIPWYWPWTADLRYACSFGDMLKVMYLKFRPVRWLLAVLEVLQLVPYGANRVLDDIDIMNHCTGIGGQEHIFTPMYLMVGRKPVR